MIQSNLHPSVRESAQSKLNFLSVSVEPSSFAVIHSPPDTGRYCKRTSFKRSFMSSSVTSSSGHNTYWSGLFTFRFSSPDVDGDWLEYKYFEIVLSSNCTFGHGWLQLIGSTFCVKEMGSRYRFAPSHIFVSQRLCRRSC